MKFDKLKKELTAYKFTDKETISGIQKLYHKSKYLLDLLFHFYLETININENFNNRWNRISRLRNSQSD